MTLDVETASGRTTEKAELCLVCTGREPVVPEGVQGSGVEVGEGGGIHVDGHMRTSVPGVYAAGDVTGSHMYAYVASREAEVAVMGIVGEETAAMRYDLIPRVVFTDPEVASVGKGVAGDREPGRQGVFPVSALGRARTMDESEGFARVACAPGGEISSVSIAAPHATELIAWATLALNQGLTLEDFLEPICPHPTLSEILREAALDAAGLCIHKP